ncbi:MAG: homocysteine S-methyltransferase family protein, partial [Myxococcota bacterium]|nr:homocysteine S-methyltransferase family protein [Myxococcota bacterium]
HPDRIADAHRAYAEAGADVVHAVTFGANPVKLAVVGLQERAEEVNRRAVALARDACPADTLIAGDVGPTGKFFPPMGDATEDRLRDVYTSQVGWLADAGVDLISIETMYDLREAKAAVEAARATELPVLASMTFDRRKRGFFTLVGDRVIPSLQALREAGADAVGFNCSLESAPMIDLVREAAAGVDAPLLAQPNAGQPRPTADGVVYDADEGQFVADLLQMVEVGARIIGGCCGTDPSFIAGARQALDSLDAA